MLNPNQQLLTQVAVENAIKMASKRSTDPEGIGRVEEQKTNKPNQPSFKEYEEIEDQIQALNDRKQQIKKNQEE